MITSRRWQTCALLPLIAGITMAWRGPRDFPGRWEGTSTCVKAPWNAACNDEVIRYDVVPEGPDASHVMLHAFKLVGSAYESMGDLAFDYDTAARAWHGDFANSRVRIRWTYRVTGDSLAGEVVLLPEQRIGRHVVANRVRGK